ncbi:MAG: hypothetical protein SWJ54_12935, partial [Cyanobacteriota bacterium]|nr:hypothetical protein [Cyanobacteriota bacterium]
MSAAATAKTVIKISTLGSRITSKSVAPRGKKISTAAIKRGNWLDSFIGFFTQRIGRFFRSINFQKIWGWCVAAFNTIWNFNWAATDEELDK